MIHMQSISHLYINTLIVYFEVENPKIKMPQ